MTASFVQSFMLFVSHFVTLLTILPGHACRISVNMAKNHSPSIEVKARDNVVAFNINREQHNVVETRRYSKAHGLLNLYIRLDFFFQKCDDDD